MKTYRVDTKSSFSSKLFCYYIMANSYSEVEKVFKENYTKTEGDIINITLMECNGSFHIESNFEKNIKEKAETLEYIYNVCEKSANINPVHLERLCKIANEYILAEESQYEKKRKTIIDDAKEVISN